MRLALLITSALLAAICQNAWAVCEEYGLRNGWTAEQIAGDNASLNRASRAQAAGMAQNLQGSVNWQRQIGSDAGVAYYQCMIKAYLEKANSPEAIGGNASAHTGEPFTGFWKKKCSDTFGIHIAPASSNRYSVSFCGPGGCFAPGEWRPNTSLVGDGAYQVIDSSHIKLNGRDGWTEYVKCSNSADPKEGIQVKTANNIDTKVTNTAQDGATSASNSAKKNSPVKEQPVTQCIRFENGMGLGGSDDMTAFLVNRCSFKVAVNFCYTGPGVTTGTCADGVGLEWVQPNGKSTISGPWAKSGGKWRWHVFACKDPASPHVVGTATGMKGYCSQ